MANTWNVCSDTRRTQQETFAVSPSSKVATGLRNSASRVSPTGKSLTSPSVIHAPTLDLFLDAGPSKIPHQRHGKHRSHQGVQPYRKLEQEDPPRLRLCLALRR